MDDRVDPIGGWFNLGDRVVGELPSLEDSRVTQTRSSESTGMQPRQGDTSRIRIAAFGMSPDTNGGNFTKQGVWVESSVVTPNSVSFYSQLPPLPAGTFINSLTLSAFKIAGGGVATATLSRFPSANVVAADVPFFVPSTSSGAWKTDTCDFVCSGATVEQATIQDGFIYVVGCTIQLAAGKVSGDVKISHIEVAVKIPA